MAPIRKQISAMLLFSNLNPDLTKSGFLRENTFLYFAVFENNIGRLISEINDLNKQLSYYRKWDYWEYFTTAFSKLHHRSELQDLVFNSKTILFCIYTSVNMFKPNKYAISNKPYNFGSSYNKFRSSNLFLKV